MAKRPTVYVVDANTYVFRAYHAVRGLRNRSGLATNAVFGFSQMMLKLLDDEKPSHIAVVFDARGPSFRKELYEPYKANRPPMPEDLAEQLPYVRKVVDGLRLSTFVIPGFEADDIVATLARRCVEAGYDVAVVSSDKDLAQLVTDRVTLVDTMSDRRYDPAAVEEKWGVPPRLIPDLLGLMGDSADNLPGVKGVGAKGAATLLGQYGSVQGIYDNLASLKGKRRENLENGRGDAFLCRDLAVLRSDAPLPAPWDGTDHPVESLAVGEPDATALHELYKELEFRRLSERFEPESDTIEQDYVAVTDRAGLDEMTGAIRAAGAFAFDLETTSLRTVEAEIVGLSFSAGGPRAWYVPVAHRGLDVPTQLPLDDVLAAVAPLLTDPELERFAQNHKYDVSILARYGIDVGPMAADPMLSSYVLDPGSYRHGMDALAQDWLGYRTTKFEEVAGKGKKQVPFAHVPVPQATAYACEDAHITFLLARKLAPHVTAAQLDELLRDVELPLARVLGRVEMTGMAVDVERLAELSRGFARRMVELERKAHEVAGVAFNLGSPKQLAEILFDRLGLPSKKRTKTGRSTDSAVLEALAELHALPKLVLAWRKVQKLRGTYADALPKLVYERTGRIHGALHQAVAATGRLSSSDPNLQNIPVRTEEGRLIRGAFAAPEGHVLLSADYSQIELRVLAHLSEDAALVRAFREGLDVHTQTAAEIHGVFPETVTREQRSDAKAINFGIVYGMGATRLAAELGIKRKAAQAMIERYFARYPGVKGYLDGCVQQAREHGEVRTLLGRRRLIPDIESGNPRLRSVAERAAINTPVQGSAADLIKLAMLNVQRALDEQGLQSKMLLQVHDELLFEVPVGELAALEDLLREQMQGVYPLRVPLIVDIHTGRSWSDAHG